ncbi:MAG: DUF559 domain-containing protein [Anaerolineae bacterium]
MNDYDDLSPVLVVVINNARDFARARDEGWYRIPVRRAPRRVAADYIAFYQTRAFGDEAYAVRYLAPVRRVHVMPRRQLLPNEPDHPRADETYYKIELGPLQRLPQPVRSRALRRITFIPTTLGQLLTAQEINDLWWRDDPQQRLWLALREAGLSVEYRYEAPQPAGDVVVDFAVFLPGGRLAVLCDEQAGPDDLREPRLPDYELTAAGWQVLRFTVAELQADLPGCVTTVLAAAQRLGG